MSLMIAQHRQEGGAQTGPNNLARIEEKVENLDLERPRRPEFAGRVADRRELHREGRAVES